MVFILLTCVFASKYEVFRFCVALKILQKSNFIALPANLKIMEVHKIVPSTTTCLFNMAFYCIY